jgi:hypothetical protein
MEPYAEILKYILPAIIVFFTVYFMMRHFLSNDEKRRRSETIISNNKIITPIRLQAYERIVLFLERISPESLLVRIKKQGMTSQELQSALLKQIRAEFEHNLSQQIYMTQEAWDVVVNSKENMVKLVNLSALEVNPASPSIELGKIIIEKTVGEKSPTRSGIDMIKKEVSEFF